MNGNVKRSGELLDLDTPKGRIVAAALELFAESGYHAVSVRDIARKVGIKDASIYSHFASKEEILQTVISRFGVVFRASIPDESEFEDIFRICDPKSFLSRGFETFKNRLQDPSIAQTYMVLVREKYDNGLAATAWERHRRNVVAYVAKAFAVMMRRGLIHPRDPEALARLYEYPLFFLIERYIVAFCRGEDTAHIESELASHREFFLDLIGWKHPSAS